MYLPEGLSSHLGFGTLSFTAVLSAVESKRREMQSNLELLRVSTGIYLPNSETIDFGDWSSFL